MEDISRVVDLVTPPEEEARGREWHSVQVRYRGAGAQHGIRISKVQHTFFCRWNMAPSPFLLANRGKASTLAQSEGREVAIKAVLAGGGTGFVRSQLEMISKQRDLIYLYFMPFMFHALICSMSFYGPCHFMFRALYVPFPLSSMLFMSL